MSRRRPAKRPCATCPYRKDVPSGVWAASEYEKLPPYDRETHAQPPKAFYCHVGTGRLCSGWVGCHDMSQSLSLRLAVANGQIDQGDYEAALDYVSPVELFESGQAVAEHGLRDVEYPGWDAARAIDRIVRHHERGA